MGDGLYPNDTIFKICNSNKWDFIFTFKDGNLSTIREQITCEKQDNQTTEFEYVGTEKAKVMHYNGFYVNNLIYKNHKLQVIENKVKTVEKEPCRFVHVTNVEIYNDNSKEVSQTGRLRWKIENEGFNDPKNGGYNLSHKFSRKSHKTRCNYYQCMQIAHIIQQLNTLSLEYKKRQNKNANESQKSLLEFVIGAVSHADFDTNEIELILLKNCRFR